MKGLLPSAMRIIASLFLLTALSCSDTVTPTSNLNGGEADAGSDGSVEVGNVPDAGAEDATTNLPDSNFPPDFAFDLPNIDPDTGPVVLSLEQVIPPNGPTTGGTPVVVKGTGFSEDTVVYFGSRIADLSFVAGDLVGESPSAPGPGSVTVKVLHPSLGEEALAGGFVYLEGLELNAIVPSRVPTTGNVEITMTGNGFTPNTRVSFNGVPALRETFDHGQQLRVLVPSNVVGPAEVRVTNPTGTVIDRDLLVYFDPVVIASVNPAAGPTIGGTRVDIKGTGFTTGTEFRFDGVLATNVTIDPGGVSAQLDTPVGSGLVNVQAQTTEGEVAIKTDAFFYSDSTSLNVVGLSPSFGESSGGDVVRIIGTGLDAAGITVTFDGVNAPVMSSDFSTLDVTTPPGAGTVNVVVTDGSTTQTLTNAFTFVADLTIDSITPNTDDVSGGLVATVLGAGLTGTTSVRIGGVASAFSEVSDTELTVTIPAHGVGVVDVDVVRGQLSAELKNGFTYTEDLLVSGFYPIKGSVAGNTYVEIRGRGFDATTTVKFGANDGLDVAVLDPQTLSVRTPPFAIGVVDVSVSRGATTEVAPYPYTYFDPGARFGGAWGDPVAGAVNVTVYSTGGAPIENAFVMLSTNAQTPYQERTDVNGMATLSGPDVYGEQTVTAVAAGFSSGSVQRVDAENITIFLSPPPEQGPPPPGTPPAVYTGYISGLDKLAEPGPDEFQMAIVQTTQIDPFTQNPAPGGGNVVLTNGEYTLQSRLGDLAVVAVGGLYNNATQVFTPLAMGIERFQFASSGITYTVDLDLNIPLDTVLNFKVNNSPRYPLGPDENRVIPFMDLGFEGVFGGIDTATGNTPIVQAKHQAAITGVLSDITYFAWGGAFTGGQVPLSVGFARNITSTAGIIDIPGLIGIAKMTSPSDGNFPIDRLFEFDLIEDQEPDFFYVNIITPLQVPVWQVFLPGSERSFRLPDFPDFSDLPPEERPVPYPGGQYLVDIIAIKKPGFNYANVTYNDLGINDVSSYSYARTLVFF